MLVELRGLIRGATDWPSEGREQTAGCRLDSKRGVATPLPKIDVAGWWKQGGGGEESQEKGNSLREARGDWRWIRSWSALLPWPRQLHDWDMQLWQHFDRPSGHLFMLLGESLDDAATTDQIGTTMNIIIILVFLGVVVSSSSLEHMKASTH